MPQQAISNFLLSILPLLPLVVGLLRYHRMDKAYHPLVWICAAGTVAEIWRFWEVYQYYTNERPTNMLGYNIYVLIVSQCYLLLFYRWHMFKQVPLLLRALQVAFLLVWVADHFFLQGIRIMQGTVIFRLVYASALCLLAIQQVNRLIIHYRKNLLKSPSFLICTGILLLFVPYILQEAILLFDPQLSKSFFTSVFNIRPRINAFVYFLYLLAIVWTPTRKPFMML